MVAPKKPSSPMGLTSSRGKRPSRLHCSMIGMRLSSMKSRAVLRVSSSSSESRLSNPRKSTPLNLNAIAEVTPIGIISLAGRNKAGLTPKRERRPVLRPPLLLDCSKSLEHVLQCELQVAFALGIVDQAEGVPDRRVGSNQDGVVQDIDCLGPELQALVLKGREALGDAEVDCLQARAGEAANLAVAKGARPGLRDRVAA